MKALKLTVLTVLLSIIAPLSVRAATTPDTTDDVAGRDQRLQSYITTYPVKLTDKEQAQLITTCEVAQDNLQKLYIRLASTVSERSKVYALVDTRLSAVQKRLTAHQLDTSVIDLLLANYRKQTSTFDVNLITYRQTLNDASSMDCKTNPAGFRSSVEAVRIARKTVADASSSIHDIVVNDTKTSFDTIKKRLNTGTE